MLESTLAGFERRAGAVRVRCGKDNP